MPLSRREFEEGRIDLAVPIFEVLAGLSGVAFTAEEIRQMVARTYERNSALEETEEALADLISQERVESKEIENERWYTVVRRTLGFLRE